MQIFLYIWLVVGLYFVFLLLFSMLDSVFNGYDKRQDKIIQHSYYVGLVLFITIIIFYIIEFIG